MYIFCTIFSGAFILGLIGDKFGRKLALILAVLLAGGSGCLQAFVGDRTLFALLRITVGMGGMGMFMIPAIFAGSYLLDNIFFKYLLVHPTAMEKTWAWTLN